VREDGRIVGGEGWQEKVHNREEWQKLLRKAGNRRILHMPMERMCVISGFICEVDKNCALLGSYAASSGVLKHR